MKDIEKVIKIAEAFNSSYGQGWGSKSDFQVGVKQFSFRIESSPSGIGCRVTLDIEWLDKTGEECVIEWLRLKKERMDINAKKRARINELLQTPEVQEYLKLTQGYFNNVF